MNLCTPQYMGYLALISSPSAAGSEIKSYTIFFMYLRYSKQADLFCGLLIFVGYAVLHIISSLHLLIGNMKKDFTFKILMNFSYKQNILW